MNSVYRQIQSLAIAVTLAFGLQACTVSEILPNAEFNTLMVDADAAIHDGRWQLAETKLEQAARLQPNSLGVRLKQGRVQQQSGKLAQAHNTYQQIIDSASTASGKDLEIIKEAREYQARLGFKPLDKTEVVEPAVSVEASSPINTEARIADVQAVANPPVAEARELPPEAVPPVRDAAADDEAVIRTRLDAWRLAWQQQRVSDYLAFYVADFSGDLDSHAAWRQQRNDRISAADGLQIEIADLQVSLQAADQATVTFTQRYRADRHRDVGLKILRLQKVDNEWLIVSEQFRKQ